MWYDEGIAYFIGFIVIAVLGGVIALAFATINILTFLIENTGSAWQLLGALIFLCGMFLVPQMICKFVSNHSSVKHFAIKLITFLPSMYLAWIIAYGINKLLLLSILFGVVMIATALFEYYKYKNRPEKKNYERECN